MNKQYIIVAIIIIVAIVLLYNRTEHASEKALQRASPMASFSRGSAPSSPTSAAAATTTISSPTSISAPTTSVSSPISYQTSGLAAESASGSYNVQGTTVDYGPQQYVQYIPVMPAYYPGL